MSTEAPVKPKPQGMLSQDIDKAMNPDLANAPVENSTTIMMRPKVPPAEKKPEATGLLDNIDASPAEPKKPEKLPQQSFKELAALREKAERERDEYKAELDKTKKGSVDSEAFRTRAEIAERELEKAALERSPAFRQKYVEKPKELIDQAKALSKDFEVPETVIDRAVAMEGKERREFIDQNFNSPSAVSEITQILHSVDDLFKARKQELDNHKESLDKYAKIQQEELEKQGIQTKEVAIQKFEKMLPAVADKLGGPFKKTGEADHDSGVESNLKMARSLVDGTANEEDIAVAPYLAVAARSYMKEAKSLRERLAKAEARLKQYGDSEPLGTHTDASGERPTGGGKPKGMLERANEDFGRR